jgi:RNA polymerase sigma-70 factor, ECF subfamily
LDIAKIEALYREHGKALLGYLKRTFSMGTAEDLLHETFLRALRCPPDRLAAVKSARAWLFGIARHVGLDALRQSRYVNLPGEIPAAPSPQTDDRVEQVRRTLARLPSEQRETLELRLVDELTYEEIATALDIPVGTVRSRLHHAIRRLREILADGD